MGVHPYMASKPLFGGLFRGLQKGSKRGPEWGPKWSSKWSPKWSDLGSKSSDLGSKSYHKDYGLEHETWILDFGHVQNHSIQVQIGPKTCSRGLDSEVSDLDI